MGRASESRWCGSSSFSSAASSIPLPTPTPTPTTTTKDLSTDLRLGLSISPPSQPDFSSSSTSTPRGSRVADERRNSDGFFVKVNLEGVPIGRKLDLFAVNDYDELIKTLGRMFTTTLLWPDVDQVNSDNYYVLTYEDKEGDWMMVGDVPWEMFLTTVKRLKITKADRC
ncbi:hypothetical protein LguiA_000891 [Lonicera macranthoides]